MVDSLLRCNMKEGIIEATAMTACPDPHSFFQLLYSTSSFRPNRELCLELDRKLIESSS
jgi:hypothetical protein